MKIIYYVRKIVLKLSTGILVPGPIRLRMIRFGGVDLSDVHRTFVGDNVFFDTVYPEMITIGNHVHLTAGCRILTHSLETSKKGINWKKTRVVIEDDCFIGTNTIICNNVVIGKNSIVGAGSVVTKDIPANEVWAGNPARFIKYRLA